MRGITTILRFSGGDFQGASRSGDSDGRFQACQIFLCDSPRLVPPRTRDASCEAPGQLDHLPRSPVRLLVAQVETVDFEHPFQSRFQLFVRVIFAVVDRFFDLGQSLGAVFRRFVHAIPHFACR